MAKAKGSPQLRCNLDLRNSPEDKSPIMLNAMEPGTVMLETKDGKYTPLSPDEIMEV